MVGLQEESEEYDYVLRPPALCNIETMQSSPESREPEATLVADASAD